MTLILIMGCQRDAVNEGNQYIQGLPESQGADLPGEGEYSSDFVEATAGKLDPFVAEYQIADLDRRCELLSLLFVHLNDERAKDIVRKAVRSQDKGMRTIALASTSFDSDVRVQEIAVSLTGQYIAASFAIEALSRVNTNEARVAMLRAATHPNA